MSSIYTAEEMVNLFLFGTTTRPTDLTSAERVRPTGQGVRLEVDINDYMDNGPGRFANAARFPLIQQFFQTYGLTEGTYTKDQLEAELVRNGVPPLTEFWIRLQQWAYKDSTDDYAERVWIWNTTAFQIHGDVRFVIDADGRRHIEHLAIIPFSNDGTENFDFTSSDPIAMSGAAYSEMMVDPSRIGRTVVMGFNGNGPRTRTNDFDLYDFNQSALYQVTANPLYLVGLNTTIHELIDGMAANGILPTIAEGDRPIIYGSDDGDNLGGTKTRIGIDLASHPEYRNLVSNGITYVAGDGNDVVAGTIGNDVIIGGSGRDTLSGGRGNDTLNGLDNGGADAMLAGGAGFDSYYVDNGDVVVDSDENGRVFLTSGRILLGGQRQSNSSPFYVSADGSITYEERVDGTIVAHTSEGTVTIGGGLTRTRQHTRSDGSVVSGLPGLGITLVTLPPPEPPPPVGHPPAPQPVDDYIPDGVVTVTDPSDPEQRDLSQPFDQAERTLSPIILDLNGDGVRTRSISQRAFFDFDNNGFAERTGWASASDGILARDLNHNGRIDQGGELFGDRTTLSNGNLAANGFDALAELDSNHDGKVDVRDTAWTELSVWRDGNSDGHTDEGELVSIAEAGVQSISISYQTGTLVDGAGNQHRQVGTFIDATGVQRSAQDVWFLTDTTDSIVENVPVIEDAALLSLPELAGMGNVRSLRQAMQEDTSGHLKNIVEGIAAATDLNTVRALTVQMIYAWTGVESLDPESRAASQIYGNAIGDARKLYAMERLLARDYLGTWCWGTRDPNPHGPASAVLLQAFERFVSSIESQLLAQTRYQTGFDALGFAWDAPSESVKGNLLGVVPLVTTWFASGAQSGLKEITGFIESVTRRYDRNIFNFSEFQTAILPIVGAPLASQIAMIWIGAIATEGSDNLVGDGFANHFDALGGNDSVDGAVGDDVLDGGEGSDFIKGGAGNDTLIGGAGFDTLAGGAGNDSYVFDQASEFDDIDNTGNGISDNDEVVLGGTLLPSGITVDRFLADVSLTFNDESDQAGQVYVRDFFNDDGSISAIRTIRFSDGTVWNESDIRSHLAPVGTADNDTLYGFETADVITGLAGLDEIVGYDGNDSISGGDGDDALSGGNGNDIISGDGGDDSVDGGSGADVLTGGAGIDNLQGGEGNDTLNGGVGSDTLDGGSGSDVYTFTRGDGSDTLWDFDENALDADVLRFDASIAPSDVVVRGVNDDLVLEVGNSNDRVRIINWFGDEARTNQIERIEFSDGTVWESVQITPHGVGAAPVTTGTAGNDELTGFNGYADTLRGLAGNDVLRGLSGQDTLEGGTGNDTLEGGAGSDVYIFSRGDGADSIIETKAATTTDVLRLGAGVTSTDVTARSRGEDLVVELGSGDSVTVANWLSSSDGDYQFDRLEFADGSNLTAASLTALAVATPVIGSASDDEIYGSSAYGDKLVGAAGDDSVYGMGGADTLDGGTGDDVLDGGSGSDTYLFNANQGNDTIYDVNFTGNDTDVLRFGADISPGEIAVRANGNSLILSQRDGGGSVDIGNWFLSAGGEYNLARVEFADGTIWSAATLTAAALVQVGTSGDDTLMGSNAYGDTLSGSSGADQIWGNGGNDSINGGTGSDNLFGGSGFDTFLFNAGDGADHIYESIEEEGGGELRFGSNITADSITITTNGYDLVLRLDGSTDSVTVSEWFSLLDFGSPLNSVVFANGASWSGEQLTLWANAAEIIGGAGNDVLEGRSETSDVFAYSLGGGIDHISSQPNTGVPDVLTIHDCLPSAISVWRDANHLYLDTGDGGSLIVDDFAVGYSLPITQVSFDNGTIWDTAALRAAVYRGTALDDSMTGTDGADTLRGLEGNDSLEGWGANDMLDGGAGNDYLSGGEGDDELLGQEGVDMLTGDGGNDVINGGAGNDTLDGGAAGDVYLFASGFGQDEIVETGATGDGVDVVRFAAGITPASVVIQRDVSNLYLHVGSDSVTVQGFFDAMASQVERVEFADGTVWDHAALLAAHYMGTSSADYFSGSELNEVMFGLDGNDTLEGGGGNDTLDGGAGTDTLSGGAGDDELMGQDGVDMLTGDGGNDVINGGAGNDTLDGGAGNDVYLFASGFGQDTITELSGIDTVRFATGIGAADVQLSRDQSNLYLRLMATGDLVTVAGNFDIAGSAIERVEFADGTAWDASVVSAASYLGTAGPDTFFGTEVNEHMLGLAGNDDLEGFGGDDVLEGGADADTLQGGAGADTLLGGDGDDWLLGDEGQDIFDGGAGNDALDAGTGNGADVYLFGRGDGQDVITDSDTTVNVVDILRFRANVAPADVVMSQNGNDRVFSITGTNDRITVANWYTGASERIERVEFSDGTVWDSALLSLTQIVGTEENDSLVGTTESDLIYGLGGNDLITGDAGNDSLDGGAGADSLYGGLGDDVLQGGTGNDLLFGADDVAPESGKDIFIFGVGDGHDVISDNDSSGNIDVIRFVGTLAPADFNIYQRNNNLVFQIIATGETLTVLNGQATDFRVERIEFGTGVTWDATQLSFAIVGDELDNVEDGTVLNDVATTFGGNDTITTGAGNDLLDGGAGDDIMTGGTGNDIYVVDSEFDQLTELASQGTDEVRSSLTWTLASNFENLTLPGTDNIDGTGNSVANVITGNAGNNTLDGKGGADTLSGGLGEDTYVVDNAGDIVIENAGEGIDLVRASVSVTLGANIENVTLTGSGAINATGNALDNVLTGNSGINQLSGGAGNDTYVVAQAGDTVVEAAGEGTDFVQSSVAYTLSSHVENLTLTGSGAISGTGNDLDNSITGNNGVNNLSGGIGNDTLDGGTGADTLVGGVGDDIYYADHASEVITEAAAEGTDSVRATVSYTLAVNVENLTLLGSNAINGTGNGSANTIIGNIAANVLNGGAGADTLQGGLGDDTYVVDDALDVIVESVGEGTDTVQSTISYALSSHVENLTLTGSAAANATGNDLDNILTGNSGVNMLTGGLGSDTYVVQSATDSVIETAGQGTDLVQTSVAYTLSGNVENLTLTGSGGIAGTGNELDNYITGNSGANNLSGGAGSDTLNGGTGVDIFSGGTGDDLYIVDDTTEGITEGVGEGTDSVESSVTFTLATNVENLTLTGASAINGTGNALNNVLTGNNAANTLSGGAGADTLSGGLGNDTYVVDDVADAVIEASGAGTDTVQSTISYSLGANVENLTLTGSAAVNASGNELNNTLRGNTGVNVLSGGAGNDTYVVAAGDSVAEAAGEGTDLVQSSVTYTLASNVENLTLTGSGAINATGNELGNVLTGNTGVNILTGGAGSDTLDGGAAADQMSGGTGDDTYVIDTAGETITENVGEGTDTVQSSITYTLANNVENLVLAVGLAINGTGNALNNTITGNELANTLNGGAGADVLVGGASNDIYVVDDVNDVVTENAAEGTDTVQSTANCTLSANVENLTLTGSSNINATGNELANTLTGNAGINTLAGGLGNDTYVVGVGDLIVENASEGIDLVQSAVSFSLSANVENLTLTASAAVNATGNELDNVLTGNTGVNVLTGGAGNDTYVVGTGDSVVENAAEGTDIVQSALTYTLAANVENLTLTGSGAINGTGNELDNVLTGNTGVNVLTGGAGNDTYVIAAGDSVVENAAEGTDTVQSSIAYTLGADLENLTLTGSGALSGTGNALDNVLTGNTGVNVLSGGAGNDTYIVQNTTDSTVENAGEGIDTVRSSVTYTLGAEVENLTLTGMGAINATGNGLDNALIGNESANTLNGGLGADSMAGGAGNDIYVIENVGDSVVENADEGLDTVQSALSYTLGANLENLTLTGSGLVDGVGNSLDNTLIGNTANNTLTGGAGNDLLNGGSGTDAMLGGVGDDTYVVAQSADVATELSGEGIDLVESSVSYTLGNYLENLALTGSSSLNATGNALDNFLTGNAGINTLTAHAGNDTLDGGAGTDTMIGGAGDDTYYSDVTGETINEAANEGLDQVISAATQTLAANVEMLFLTGSAQVNGTGNVLSNLLRGNEMRNVLTGGGGIDILEGGGGNDTLSNTGGGVFNGGAGNDALTGGAGHDLFIGGLGTDTITTSSGRDIIAFNLGDGADTISTSTVKDNTVSLGGGVTYADLLFERTGNNLTLRVGASDQLTFTNYYASASNRSISNLQILIEGTSDYDVNSSDALKNKKVETFDFDGLVAAFDTARATDPLLTSWSLTNALAAEHLGGSDSEALGGDLAYQYGRFGNLSDISLNPALAILGASAFGQSAQLLQSSMALHDPSPRMS
jgi:Ca2+-binding RTX toxin-like protein